MLGSRVLAYEIESHGRWTYADIPPAKQSKLASDQFVQALAPDKLCLHVQFLQPAFLGKVLDCAIKWETALCDMSSSPSIVVASVTEALDKRPAWVDELFHAEQVHAAQPPGNEFKRHPPVCWGCGQRGHLLLLQQQGNRAGWV